MTLADRLKKVLDDRGVTQKQLAEAVNATQAGISLIDKSKRFVEKT